jgi:hypothetical protein
MILAIVIVCATIAAKVFYDYREWLKKKPLNHAREWVVMALANSYPIYLFVKASTLHWIYGAILSGAMVAFFIWVVFDGLYNLVRGYHFFFTGTNDSNDARTDNFLQSLSLWQHVAVKCVGLATLIGLYLRFVF